MAQSKSTRPRASRPARSDIAALRRRCDALGYRLIVADNGDLFVLGGKGGLECVYIHQSEEDDELTDWLESVGDRWAAYFPEEPPLVKESTRSGMDRPSVLTRGQVMRAYALVSAARAQLDERRAADPDSAASAGADIACELLGLSEDVLMGNEGGTPAGAGFERGGA